MKLIRDAVKAEMEPLLSLNADKYSQKIVKEMLHEIRIAETRTDAHVATDPFLETYRNNYPKAADCLEKEQDRLQIFNDFPTQHRQLIQTTNPIESTLTTEQLRTAIQVAAYRGYHKTASQEMVYKLGTSIRKHWHRLRGLKHLAVVIEGLKFKDGIPVYTEKTCGVVT